MVSVQRLAATLSIAMLLQVSCAFAAALTIGKSHAAAA